MKKKIARTFTSIKQSINKRRIAYSLAAGAAACTAGTADDAAAAIVYSGLQNITNFPATNPPYPDPYRLFLDLDSSGSTDVALQNATFGGVPYQGGSVFGNGGRFVGFESLLNGYNYISNLSPGAVISSGAVNSNLFFGNLGSPLYPYAQFNSTDNGFIGLSFGPSPAQLKYGWLRVKIVNGSSTFIVKDWAYESEIGVGITAGNTGDGVVPEPGTLGLLAAGAAGVFALRRRREQAA